MALFQQIGFNCFKAREPVWADSLLLPLSPYEILVLISSTYEGWKAEPFPYWSLFKLNLILYRCCSVLGQGNNQKQFKCTFQQYIVFHVLKQDRAVILKNHEDKFSANENFDKK